MHAFETGWTVARIGGQMQHADVKERVTMFDEREWSDRVMCTRMAGEEGFEKRGDGQYHCIRL